MKPITNKQRDLLMFCGDFYAENDQLPPYYVSAAHFAWASVNAAVEMMDALRRKGFVERNAVGKFKLTDRGRAYITERQNELMVSDGR